MTTTPEIPDGLEKRLRDAVEFNQHYETLREKCREAADALAKARVALKYAEAGVCDRCGKVFASKHGHDARCPIGAALEAMGK